MSQSVRNAVKAEVETIAAARLRSVDAAATGSMWLRLDATRRVSDVLCECDLVYLRIVFDHATVSARKLESSASGTVIWFARREKQLIHVVWQ